MKKTMVGVLCAGVSLSVLAVPADRAMDESHWQVGLLATSNHYREKDGSFLMREDGALLGVDINWVAHKPSRWVYFWDMTTAVGKMDYDSRDTGAADGFEDWLFETRARMGYDFSWLEARVTPYVGLGYRFLSDDSVDQHSTTGATGYLRESSYHYAPAGFQVADKLADWQSSFVAEYDVFLYGDQYSFIATGDPFHNRQHTGYGWRASWRFSKPVPDSDSSWYVMPSYTYWHIRNSEVDCKAGSGCGFEPDNTTRQYAVHVGLVF